ncbi:MAG: hypothetical protein WAT39_17335 [Planctomycetota bacterium]
MKSSVLDVLAPGALGLLAVLTIAGCNHGGGQGSQAQTQGTLVSGTAVKGPVQFAEASLFELLADGTKGVQIGPEVVTLSDGSFIIVDLSTKSSTGFLLIEIRPRAASTYRDEHLGTDVSLSGNDLLQAVFRQEVTNTVSVTPLTHMAAGRALFLASQGAPIDLAVESANIGVAQHFGLSDIVHVVPVDPTNEARSQVASTEERIYGLILGAIARQAALTPTPAGYSSTKRALDLTTALATDVMDGTFDGANGAPIKFPIPTSPPGIGAQPATLAASAATTGLQARLNEFVANETQNRTNIPTHAIRTTVGCAIGSTSPDDLRILTTTIPAWVSGQPGTALLEASGGFGRKTWRGSLPMPFVLANGADGVGTITGTDTLVGGTTRKLLGPFTVTVTDEAAPTPNSCDLQLVITVIQPPPELTLHDPESPVMQGAPVDFQLAAATGGTGPYWFTLDTGNGFQPIGLQIDANGRLRGTPTVVGRYSFGVCAVDLTGSQTCRDYTIDVAPASGGVGGGFAGTWDFTWPTNTTSAIAVNANGSFSGFAFNVSNNTGSCSFPVNVTSGTFAANGTVSFSFGGSGCSGYSQSGSGSGTSGLIGTASGPIAGTAVTPGGSIALTGTWSAVKR